jgi:hypothetical protein
MSALADGIGVLHRRAASLSTCTAASRSFEEAISWTDTAGCVCAAVRQAQWARFVVVASCGMCWCFVTTRGAAPQGERPLQLNYSRAFGASALKRCGVVCVTRVGILHLCVTCVAHFLRCKLPRTCRFGLIATPTILQLPLVAEPRCVARCQARVVVALGSTPARSVSSAVATYSARPLSLFFNAVPRCAACCCSLRRCARTPNRVTRIAVYSARKRARPPCLRWHHASGS